MIRRLFDTLGRRARRGSQPPPAQLVAGDIVSVVTDDGRFGVVKVLVADAGGVHARLYVQRFDQRPNPADIGELSMAPFGTGYDNPFSIGHMPLSYGSFAGWLPEIIAQGVPVDEDELEGYRMWLDAQAGYF